MKLSLKTLLLALLLGIGCASVEIDESGKSVDASDSTAKYNKSLYETYPFKDKQDFEDVKKGFIAPLENDGVLKGHWDLSRFKKLVSSKDAPATVNPSLWRQSQLLSEGGLFEVVKGVYQVRSLDISNITFVEGVKGVTVYDPLVTKETAAAALKLYRKHRGNRKVVAVIFTHSHVDHFGGVKGIVSEKDVKSGKVKIYAPEEFMEHAISENVFAGTAMSRRAAFMYGNMLPVSEKGQVGAGLGLTTSSGTPTILAPTDIIRKTGEKRTIDGLTYEFIVAPGSEAPAEMMWYIPQYKMINVAEEVNHTQHNLYTLRGAKTRDARLWPMYLNQVLQKYGQKYDVLIGMHHWPTWGRDRINKHIEAQRDTYKYIHDQTLHFANQGYTMNELPDLVKLPDSLVNQWASHGYYGSTSHNVRAVYNYYLGYYDGNPANLNPLPPEQLAKKYVDALGGSNKILEMGKKAYDNGEYRWGATLVNNLVFADPDNKKARFLQAMFLEQMGYQAESGPWRNFYLSGAQELRQENGEKPEKSSTASPDILQNMTLDLIFDYMGIQLDAEKVKDLDVSMNWVFPDVKKNYTLFIKNSVINYWPDNKLKNANVTITMNRSTLDQLIGGALDPKKAIQTGKIKISGDGNVYKKLLTSLVNLNDYFWFGIARP